MDLTKLINQNVRHNKYGSGVIVGVEDEFIKCKFGEEIKTFMPYSIIQHSLIIDSDANNKIAIEIAMGDKKKTETALKPYLDELNQMIGLSQIKEQINDIICEINVNKLRAAFKLKVPSITRHLVFTGAPGTGKTTIARMLANIYKTLGVLPTSKLVEVDRSGLIGGYAGQTALKTREVFERAVGGVLFIDEAYAICRNETDDYGYEALDTLTKCLEDYRENIVVIVAGYKDEMEKFLNANPGLSSRFKTVISFDDYSNSELLDIFLSFLRNNDYHLDKNANKKIKELFKNIKKLSGNGREVRNMFEDVIRFQARRLNNSHDITVENLSEIKECDLALVQNRYLAHSKVHA